MPSLEIDYSGNAISKSFALMNKYFPYNASHLEYNAPLRSYLSSPPFNISIYITPPTLILLLLLNLDETLQFVNVDVSVMYNPELLIRFIFNTDPFPYLVLSMFENVHLLIFRSPDYDLYNKDPTSRIIYVNEQLVIIVVALFILIIFFV